LIVKPILWLGLLAVPALAQQPQEPKPAASPDPPAPARRADINVLGQVNAAAGESRRNENVQFNLIDNNALKELNIRLGTTATIVQPFRVEQNYFGAEFGTAPSSILHLPPARLNPFHGAVHATHNNSIFSARSFFQVGEVQPARENAYGFQFSAGLWRDAALTLDGSQNKIRGNVNGNVLVPLAEERIPLTRDPAVRGIVERYMRAYPDQLPNRTDIDIRALNTNAPQVVDGDAGLIRFEQALPKGDRLILRHQYSSQVVDAFQFVAGKNPDTTTKSHGSRITWNRAWSGNLVTDFSAGFDRVRSLLVPEPNAVGPLVLTGQAIDFLGPSESLPIDRVENRFRYSGGVQQRHGAHLMHYGFELLRRRINGAEEQAHRGIFFFSNDFGRDAITNIRMGTPSRYQKAIGGIHRGFRTWDMRFYWGDSWQARPGFTLSYGMRYQPAFAPVEVNGLSDVPYECDCNNVAPRFGFAWQTPRNLGVMRAAYGIHYGEIFPVTYQQIRFNPPGNVTVVVPEANLADPLRGLRPADLAPDARSSLRLLDPDLAAPYSHQYNFSWEPPLGKTWKLQLGYAGSRTHRLFVLWYNNRARPAPGIPTTSATVNERRPDSRYFDVYRVVNGSRGYYDAAKITLIAPRWRGLSLDASYWFSKALDLGSDYTNVAYERDGRLSRSQFEDDVQRDMKGLSTFDQKHALLLRAAWESPRVQARSRLLARLASRWNLSAVILRKSGTPFEIQSGSDGPGFGNVDGQNGDRVHILDPSLLGHTVGHPDEAPRLMPRTGFAFMRPGELRGSIGHHVFRKGIISNVNASLARTFALGGDRTMQFRAESINFFNTPQFAEPNRDLAAPSFGTITNTLNDGRTFRFTLRFGF
jgi:hypothetical protein